MFIIMFLLVGAFFIVGENNLSLNSKENLSKFSALYALWLDNLFNNVGALAGYVVKMEWLPANETG